MLHRMALAALLLIPVASRAGDSYEALVKDFEKKLPARGIIADKDGKELAARFLEFAATNENDPNAVDALGRILQIGRLLAEEDQAAELLIRKYAKSDKLAAAVVERLGGYWTPAREKALRGIWEKAAGDAKGQAAFRLLQQLKTRALMAVDLKEQRDLRMPIYDGAAIATIERSDLTQLLAEAEALAKHLEAADVTIGKTPARAAVPGLIAGFRNIPRLLVGQPAPELELVNLAGKKQRLSDLEGKVVVIDIWATWCPPCRAMIPHERALVKRLKDKPFALVSISADDNKDTLTKFLEKTEMPWTHWHNGSKGGMLDSWNIRFFPTIYVLDAKGVIRFKGVRGQAMDDAVDKLLKELEPQG